MRLHYHWLIWLVLSFMLKDLPPAAGTMQDNVRQAKADTHIAYTLQHPLHKVNGVSNQVSSQLMLAEGSKTINQVEVRVPVRSFDSGNRARDRDMLEVTEADLYPYVTFASSQITAQNGQLTVTGQLTFHGVTRETTFNAQQQWEGEGLVVEGEFEISLEEYNIKRPSLFGMKIKDTLQVRFHMVYPNNQ